MTEADWYTGTQYTSVAGALYVVCCISQYPDKKSPEKLFTSHFLLNRYGKWCNGE